MPSLTDTRFAALRVLVPAAPPTTNDMLRAYLLANGGVGASLNDLWYTFFLANGATAGHHNDMAKEFLVAQGFTQPHLNDAWMAFWLAGGSLGPSAVAQINNVTRLFQTPDVNPNDSSLFWELQSGGFSVIGEVADTGGGPPNFFNQNVGTDWIIPRPPTPGSWHAQWNQIGGNTGADGGSTPQATWVDISSGGGLIFGITGQGVQTLQIVGAVDISDDGGSTVHDSAVVDITLDLTP